MAIEQEDSSDRVVCRLSGGLNIWEAGEVWQQLLPLLTDEKPLTLDLSEVSECDGAGVQILCQIRNISATQSNPITIESLSEPVTAAMQQAGLDHGLFTQGMEEI